MNRAAVVYYRISGYRRRFRTEQDARAVARLMGFRHTIYGYNRAGKIASRRYL